MKRFLSIVLVLVFCCAFFACGKEEAEKYCWSCGEGVAKSAAFCEYCGANISVTGNEIDTTTTTDKEDITTTITEQETTVTTAEATTTKATTTTTTTTTTAKPTTQANGMTKDKALKIAKDLIAHIEIYEMFGCCCDLEYVDDSDARKIISASGASEYVYHTLYKSTCCKNSSKAYDHICDYITGAMLPDFPFDYIEYNGNLYIVISPSGGFGYENIKIKSYSEDRIVATAQLYGDLYGDAEFTFEKDYDGVFRLV